MFSIHIIHLDINFYHLDLQDWTEGGKVLGARKSLWIVRLVLKTVHSSSKWTVRTHICGGKGKWTHLSNLVVVVIHCWSPKISLAWKRQLCFHWEKRILPLGSLWQQTVPKFAGVQETSGSYALNFSSCSHALAISASQVFYDTLPGCSCALPRALPCVHIWSYRNAHDLMLRGRKASTSLLYWMEQ